MNLGEFIAAYRKEHHLSQRKFAEKCGVSNSYISVIESGVNPKTKEPVTPTLPQYKKLAAGVGMSVQDLVQLLDEEYINLSAAPDTASAQDLPEEVYHIGQLYEVADGHIRRIVDVALEPFEARLKNRDPLLEKLMDDRVFPFPEDGMESDEDGIGGADGMREIFVYQTELPAAGYSSYFEKPAYQIEQYPENIIPKETTFGVLIGGDSMEPVHANHATAFIKSIPVVEPGQVGLFSMNGEPYIKQLIVDGESREVRLHSFNSKYQDIPVGEHDDLRVFGQVLGSYPPYAPPKDEEDE